MTLPDGYIVRRSSDHWAIGGPTGLFLVARERPDRDSSAEHTVLAAHLLRGRLAERLDIVPFVDPVLVSVDEELGDGHDCAVVDPELLQSFLLDGPTVIPEGELQLIRHHLPAVVSAIEADGGF